MSNFENPVSNVIKSETPSEGANTQMNVYLSPNEFIANDDLVGLFHSNPDPYEFFSVQKVI